jgi:hypothetical protein
MPDPAAKVSAHHFRLCAFVEKKRPARLRQALKLAINRADQWWPPRPPPP